MTAFNMYFCKCSSRHDMDERGMVQRPNSIKQGQGLGEFMISLLISSLTFCQRPNYEAWLNQIVASYQTVLDGKDKTFARFLLDLPSIPADVLELLRELCTDSSRWV